MKKDIKSEFLEGENIVDFVLRTSSTCSNEGSALTLEDLEEAIKILKERTIKVEYWPWTYGVSSFPCKMKHLLKGVTA